MQNRVVIGNRGQPAPTSFERAPNCLILGGTVGKFKLSGRVFGERTAGSLAKPNGNNVCRESDRGW